MLTDEKVEAAIRDLGDEPSPFFLSLGPLCIAHLHMCLPSAQLKTLACRGSGCVLYSRDMVHLLAPSYCVNLAPA